jgi:hypothetical protein
MRIDIGDMIRAGGIRGMSFSRTKRVASDRVNSIADNNEPLVICLNDSSTL